MDLESRLQVLFACRKLCRACGYLLASMFLLGFLAGAALWGLGTLSGAHGCLLGACMCLYLGLCVVFFHWLPAVVDEKVRLVEDALGSKLP